MRLLVLLPGLRLQFRGGPPAVMNMQRIYVRYYQGRKYIWTRWHYDDHRKRILHVHCHRGVTKGLDDYQCGTYRIRNHFDFGEVRRQS